MLYGIHLDHPIFSITPGFNEHEILIAGGGGSEKTGVPNTLRIGTLDSKGTITMKKTIEYDEQVTCISSRFLYRKNYLAIAVGSHIHLLDKLYRNIKSVDTKMTKALFKSLCISPEGRFLLAVDADFSLRLYTVPALKLKDFTSKGSVQRAVFIDISKPKDQDHDKDLRILCVSESKVQIRKAKVGFQIIAESEIFDLEPKQISIIDDLIYYTGLSKEKRKSFVIKLRYNKEKGIIETLSIATPLSSVITTMTTTSSSVAVGTADGSIALLNRNSLKTIKVYSKLHEMPATSIAAVDRLLVTGGLDSALIVTQNKGKAPHTHMILFILIILLACLIWWYLKKAQ